MVSLMREPSWDESSDFGDWIRSGSSTRPRERVVIEIPRSVLPRAQLGLFRLPKPSWWLMLALRSQSKMEILHQGKSGEDVRKVISSLNRLGAKIEMKDGKILVGISDVGFPIHTGDVLDRQKLGTGFRMLMSLCSLMPMELVTDSSLGHPFDVLSSALLAMGCEFERSNDGSVRISGPQIPTVSNWIYIERKSATLGTAHGVSINEGGIKVHIHGKPVSKDHLDLGYGYESDWVRKPKFSENSLIINPWEIVLPEMVESLRKEALFL